MGNRKTNDIEFQVALSRKKKEMSTVNDTSLRDTEKGNWLELQKAEEVLLRHGLGLQIPPLESPPRSRSHNHTREWRRWKDLGMKSSRQTLLSPVNVSKSAVDVLGPEMAAALSRHVPMHLQLHLSVSRAKTPNV